MIPENTVNYNPLGRLGPVYPRPEYRPQAGREDSRDTPAPAENEKNPLKVKISGQKTAKAAPDQSESRLTLAMAQNLVQETSAAIAGLPPGATNSGPHRLNPYWGLIHRRYV
ncbi:MAG: hypothetical protein LBP22_12775 [Deltaproteobacteria bacterium]|jgi:hypothetical protein|nr:hypothetical protein [Deltaproteobacteria bacterium]